MMFVIAFSIVALAGLGLALLLRGMAAKVNAVEDLVGRTVPVDLEAFRNLIDPNETLWLAQQLASHDFRRIQRRRIRAVLAYVALTGRNAALLLRLGEAARDSGDAEVADAGRQLASLALAVRFYVVLARLRLAAVYLWPSRAGLLNLPLADQYDTLVGRFRIVGQLQDRAQASRLLATL